MTEEMYIWHRKPIADWGDYVSDESKRFYRAFKKYLSDSFPEAELIGFNPGEYETYGFLHVNDQYIYIKHIINRKIGHVDFWLSDPGSGVIFRTAENEKDVAGGVNHYTSIMLMVDKIKDCLTSEIKAA